MPYSQFTCAGCGKKREILGSKVVYVAGKKSRICTTCKETWQKRQRREAQNGPNG